MNENEIAILVKAKDEASKVLGDVEQKAKGIGGALGDTAKIAGGFVLGEGLTRAPGFLLDAAQAAADDAANVAKLKQAVENTGAAWSDYSDQLDQVIEDGQRKAYTDDQVRNSLALLVAQTGNAGEAQKRFALAMDLSRGAGIDLETASKLLGKVTEENVNVLGRYGIKVKEGASETELFGAIQQKFGGQADAPLRAGHQCGMHHRRGEQPIGRDAQGPVQGQPGRRHGRQGRAGEQLSHQHGCRAQP